MRSTTRAASAIRAACWAPLRHRHARDDGRRLGRAQPDAGGRALPSRCRGDGGEPLCGGTVGARRRRSRSRRGLIDMGAGTTTIAVFSGGRFVHGDGFALGGQHVTMDIARARRAHRRRRAHQDAVRQRALGRLRRARHDHDAAGRSRRARGAAIRLARAARAHHQAARRGNSRNGPRPPRGLAVCGRSRARR